MAKTFDLKTKTRTVTETFITLDGKNFELTDLVNMMDELADTSYAGPRIIIHNRDLRTALVKRKVISDTAKGSLYRGPNYENFKIRIDETYKKALGS